MTNTGWTEPNEHLLLPNIDLDSIIPLLNLSSNQWKNIISDKRADILDKRAQHLPPGAGIDNKSKIYSNPNVVEIIDKSYLESRCKNLTWSKKINDIVTKYNLNTDQNRAFLIVANHAATESSDQLKMYIGGMGGTGKSQVLRALMEYFEQRNESHRFVVVAPTGSAASLLGGSTYHWMFGINDNDISKTQLAQVKSRLIGVDYVFFDEVSMLSCRDMYRICARLAQVLGYPEVPFGG
ncbi:P-loop containing nucleoside triphosphate hydrolase protein, partial [Collybia nuda]